MNKKILYGVIAGIIVIVLVVTISVFVGKEKKDDNNNTDLTNVDNSQEDVENVDTSEGVEVSDVTDLEFYSDDKQIVFMQADNVYWVFGYENNKITSYTIYIKCEDATHAVAAALAYDNTDEDVKNVTTEGKYVKVETNASAYEDMTVEELKFSFSYLKEHKK